MSDQKPSPSKIPVWAWVIGCLGLLAVCLIVVVGAGIAVFFTTSRETSPVERAVTVVSVTVEAEIPTPLAQMPTPRPTDTPPAETQLETAMPTSAPTEPAVAPPDDPFAQERNEVEQNVEAIRELDAKQPITLTLLNTSQLRQRLEEDLAEEYSQEEARHDAITLSAFNFLSPDFDLYNLLLDLYTEEIAGYYDPETAEFVVISDDQDFSAYEQWIHAHEYVHALQDQYYELELIADESLDGEASLALRALSEGDATMVQTLYLLQGYFADQDLFDIFAQASQADMSVFQSAPPIIARELEFPYTYGLAFVQALYDQGGFDAVDAAWLNLPQSTEQILHPELYLAGDEPQVVSMAPLTDTLGAGWQLVDEDTFGEFYLRQYLGQQLDEPEVDAAASGWGGDRYVVYWNEDENAVVMVLRSIWDTEPDSRQFGDIYARYADGSYDVQGQIQPDGGLCWQGKDVTCLYQAGIETFVVRAPNLDLAASIAAAQAS